MPYTMGRLADSYGMGVGFLLPMTCFFIIMIYGFIWKSLFVEDVEPEVPPLFSTH